MNTSHPQPRPNFVIGGAPKGGTTALANYLRDHDLVFFSDLKEPLFWADDFPSSRKLAGIKTKQDYLDLFASAQSSHLAIGEGSTLYLYSRVAIRKLLQFDPAMKFIFMLRRPNEIAYAYHMQMVYSGNEDVESFQEAWALQDARKTGQQIPPACREQAFLQYRDVAAIGTQIESAKTMIPDDQMMVVLFDDLAIDTAEVYRKTLAFLNVPDDGRRDFEKDNVAKKARFPIVTRALQSRPVVEVTAVLKRTLRGPLFDFAKSTKHSLMFRPTPRKLLDADFETSLHAHFVPEVEKLERLIGCDLSHWKTPVARTAGKVATAAGFESK